MFFSVKKNSAKRKSTISIKFGVRDLKYLPQQRDNDNDVSRECHNPEERFSPRNIQRHGGYHLS